MKDQSKSFFHKVLSLHYLRYLFVIVAIGVFAYGAICYKKDPCLPKTYEREFEKILENRDDSNKYIKLYDKMFDLKFSQYKNNLSEFGGIQKWMLAILITTVLVLVFGVDNVPLFGFTIPDNLIYLIVFFGGLYFWVNFGLSFSALIDDRLSLYSYLKKIEVSQGIITYYNSPKHLLMDNSLLDNWFGYYFEIFGKKPYLKLFAALGLYGIYAILLGMFKASIFISALEFIERKQLSPTISAGLILFSLAMTITATVTFLYEKNEYASFWMSAIWFVVAVCAFYWYYKGESIYKKYGATVPN